MSKLNSFATFASNLIASRGKWCVVVAILVSNTAFNSIAYAAPPSISVKYVAIDLGVYPGDIGSSANAINAFGKIVGSSLKGIGYPYVRAVIWANGTVQDLGTLSPPFDVGAEATGINDFEEVVGNSFGLPDSQGQSRSHAFVVKRGQIIDLGTLGGPNSYAAAINNKGQIVGVSDTNQTYTTPKGGPTRIFYVQHAFLWKDGVMKDLGTLGCMTSQCPAGDSSSATDINNNGQVVGSTTNATRGTRTPFLWQNGIMKELLGFAPGDVTYAFAINNFGLTLGIDDTASNAALLWNKSGEVIPVSCPALSAGLGVPVDINDLGWIVGRNQNPSNYTFFSPTLCVHGQLTILPPVGPKSADNFPARMNNLGAIVGRADLVQGTSFPDWSYLATHAVLWRPVK